MWKIICLIVLSMSIWSNIFAQEYLPPKNGKKPSLEPSLPANYDFSYDVQDNSVSLDFGHNEKRKDDQVTGSYHVMLPDGRMQLVEYTAGKEGFKPMVMYVGSASYPPPTADKFDGYHYKAASNRQTVKQAAPRNAPRQSTSSVSTPIPLAHPPIATNATKLNS